LSERTFVFLKPEAIMRDLVGDIIGRIEKRGLNIIAMKLTWMTKEQAERLYEMHKGKHFYQELIDHVTSGPILAIIVEGPNAVKLMRKIIGATDPVEAEPGTIRGDYALAKTCNIIHASDSSENAEREMKIFFKPNEILSYEKPAGESTF
jgi:nucleoside-diphosphate kinase